MTKSKNNVSPLEKLQKELTQKQKQLAAQNNKLHGELEPKLNQLQQRISAVKTQLDAHVDRLKAKNPELKEMDSKSLGFSEKKGMENKINSLNERITKQQQDIQRLQEKIDKTNQEIKILEEKIKPEPQAPQPISKYKPGQLFSKDADPFTKTTTQETTTPSEKPEPQGLEPGFTLATNV